MTAKTTYHARVAEDGTVEVLMRIREDDTCIHGELYRPGKGWMRHHGAFDAWHNAQDYDLLTEEEAEEATRQLDSGA